MHGHVQGVGGAIAQPQTMVQMQKAAALREAAQVRQTLLRAAAKEFGGTSDGDSVQLSNAWSATGSGYGSGYAGNESSGSQSGASSGAESSSISSFRAVTTIEPGSQLETSIGASPGISYWV
jgi:hypothetical protein